MAISLIMNFEGMKQDKYDGIMRELGLKVGSQNPENWPHGIISHQAGSTPSGWSVVDVWETQADFDKFMQSRLSPAFKKVGGIGEPRVTTVQLYNRFVGK